MHQRLSLKEGIDLVDLTIRDIEVIGLKVPLRKVFRGSKYHMTHRCTVITRVLTDEGIIGEAYNGDEMDAQDALIAMIKDELRPRLIGKNATHLLARWREMLPLTFDILRSRSLLVQAVACVDTALHDAVGKALDTPLYRLWGGGHPTLPVICIGGYYPEGDPADLRAVATEIERIRSEGFCGCKFKVGGLTPEDDAKRALAARAAAGEDFVLAVDANQAWTVREAVRFVQLAEEARLAWFEEPCRWYDDRSGMRDVRLMTGVAVTAGQSEISGAGCRNLMIDGAIDICNFDASWGGGPTEWRRVAATAELFGVRMGHHEEPQIASHLLAATTEGGYLECFHIERDPLFYELVANRSPFASGRYAVPTGPGWGLELDPKAVARYRVA